VFFCVYISTLGGVDHAHILNIPSLGELTADMTFFHNILCGICGVGLGATSDTLSLDVITLELIAGFDEVLRCGLTMYVLITPIPHIKCTHTPSP
jgi:hypothetical protein